MKNNLEILYEDNHIIVVVKPFNILSQSDESEIKSLRRRLARLLGGVAVIEVGAATQTELNEKKLILQQTLKTHCYESDRKHFLANSRRTPYFDYVFCRRSYCLHHHYRHSFRPAILQVRALLPYAFRPQGDRLFQ